MPSAYEKLCQQFQQISRIEHAITFLQWDQLVMMPPGGSSTRSETIAELTGMHHEMLCSEQLEEMLDTAAAEPADDMTRRSIEEMRLVRKHAAAVPSRLVRAKSLAGSRCEHGWRSQKQDNDWHGFLENFREVVSLSREEAQARHAAQPALASPYDALLDLYCTGDSSELITSVFDRLKDELPAILDEIVGRQPAPLDLAGSYPVDAQQNLCRTLMTLLGFDFERGRLDVSVHPFSTGDRGDQRITTRFKDDEFLEALLATAHETGHASYENGRPAVWDGLPIGSARNMSLHESQSLLFEKHIFLAEPFLRYFTPSLHAHLTDTRRWSADDICRAALRVEPSLIRVEADEVTYPMHIILRYEIEKGLVNGGIQPDDIPELWDAKMQEYLGLSTAGNYREGCLQDIHWTDGSFGYFPSYTMGALNAAQLMSALQVNHRDWQERLEGGDTAFIRDWLEEKIWSQASSMDSQEIISQATGEDTTPDYFLDHVKKRYLSDNG